MQIIAIVIGIILMVIKHKVVRTVYFGNMLLSLVVEFFVCVLLGSIICIIAVYVLPYALIVGGMVAGIYILYKYVFPILKEVINKYKATHTEGVPENAEQPSSTEMVVEMESDISNNKSGDENQEVCIDKDETLDRNTNNNPLQKNPLFMFQNQQKNKKRDTIQIKKPYTGNVYVAKPK